MRDSGLVGIGDSQDDSDQRSTGKEGGQEGDLGPAAALAEGESNRAIESKRASERA